MTSLRHLVNALKTLHTTKIDMPDIDNRYAQPRLVRQLVGAISNQDIRSAATSVSYAINHAISERRKTGIKSLNKALLDLTRAGTYGRKSDNRARYVLAACREIRRVGRAYLREEEIAELGDRVRVRLVAGSLITPGQELELKRLDAELAAAEVEPARRHFHNESDRPCDDPSCEHAVEVAS